MPMKSLLIQKGIYGEEISQQQNEDACIVYRACNPTGDGEMRCYPVFNGVELIYNNFHMERWDYNKRPVRNVLEINHCHVGRFECEFSDGRCTYLEEGDLAVNLLSNLPCGSSFPLGHYHGISVVIDLDCADSAVKHFLEDISVDIHAIVKRLCVPNHCFIMRATESVKHIFSELYTVPEEIRPGYMKLKVLELLLFLSIVPQDSRRSFEMYHRRAYVDKVKQIKAYLVDHPQENWTLQSLSDQYHIPHTTLKRCFRAIYGTSLHAFLKDYRLQLAAKQLRETDSSVTVIANRVGYVNPSKFAAAFKATYHMTPTEYRNGA